MENLIRVNNVDEPTYLKNGMFGYRVVHPTKNPDGSLNWINLICGGWGNLITLTILLLIFLSFAYGVNEMMTGCNDMAENPCKYTDLDCSRYFNGNPQTMNNIVVVEDVNLNE